MDKNKWIVVAIMVVILIIAGGSILMLQYWEVLKKNEDLQKKVENLQKTPEKFIRVVSPVGGEKMCLGKKFNLEWEYAGVKSVRATAYLPGEGIYYLGVFPANSLESGKKGAEEGRGSYAWDIGKAITGNTTSMMKPGDMYEITIEDADIDGNSVKGKSSGTFTISNCN